MRRSTSCACRPTVCSCSETHARGPGTGCGGGPTGEWSLSSPPARAAHAEPDPGERLRLIIITGLSGAGKSWAIKCFEDLGYYCVDNLPTTLIPTFAELCAHSTRRIARIALGADIREREYLHSVVEALGGLRGSGTCTGSRY